jgi:hypothetical protein
MNATLSVMNATWGAMNAMQRLRIILASITIYTGI